MKLDVLYEDNHIIAINKPNNVIVQSDPTGDEPLEDMVKQYIKEKYHKPGDVFLGVVHRIDRPVSGIVLFARTSKALTRLNEQFKNRSISKIYWALVKNKPKTDAGTLVHHIVRDTKKNKSFAYSSPQKESKEASLSYVLRASSENYHLLEIDLHSGRHHQIRCQLSIIGCPIKGDLKYGFPRSNPNGGISLHAYSVRFTHPVTKEPLSIIAPPPQDSLWNQFYR